MSVNIYDGTNLIPIAGKTVPMPYTPAPQSMIGDAWITSHAYAVGDYCIDGNVLYRCKTAHTSTASKRPPYASYWTAVPVASQLGGGAGWNKLTFTTSDAIQNNVLKTANEVIVTNDPFGFNCHLVKEMPNSGGASPWNVIHEKCSYVAQVDSTLYLALLGYYWDRTNGYIRTRIMAHTYSGWTDSNCYPSAILYR